MLFNLPTGQPIFPAPPRSVTPHVAPTLRTGQAGRVSARQGCYRENSVTHHDALHGQPWSADHSAAPVASCLEAASWREGWRMLWDQVTRGRSFGSEPVPKAIHIHKMKSQTVPHLSPESSNSSPSPSTWTAAGVLFPPSVHPPELWEEMKPCLSLARV